MVGHPNGFSQETHTKPSKWLIPLLLELPRALKKSHLQYHVIIFLWFDKSPCTSYFN